MKPPWLYVVSGSALLLGAVLLWSAWKMVRDDVDSDTHDDCIDLTDET